MLSHGPEDKVGVGQVPKDPWERCSHDAVPTLKEYLGHSSQKNATVGDVLGFCNGVWLPR